MQWHIERVAEATSTMDLAKARARAGAPDGTVVVAERMTAGRGQHGHTWHAPDGGLYLSFVVRGVDNPLLLTLALGNAVADVLEVAGSEPRLKWVNDVLVKNRKIAGILVEGEATGSRMDFLVAGIGINVNGHAAAFPAPLDRIATTLEDDLGCEACVPDLESFLYEALASWLERVREGRNAEILEAFRARDALKGHRVMVTGARPKPFEGIAEGIDDQGRLLVRTNGRPEAFATGEVRVA